MEEAQERKKKTAGGLHRLGRVVGMAVVAVACVFAASMTSEANRTYLVNSVRIWSGDDSKIVTDNDEKNEKSNLDEEVAVAEIEEKLNVEVPQFYYRPYGLVFNDYLIDDPAVLAWIEYEYEGKCITLLIDRQNNAKASRIRSISGNEKEVLELKNGDVLIKIGQIDDDNEDKPSYLAEWDKDGVAYALFGKIELQEIEEIIKNMKF